MTILHRVGKSSNLTAAQVDANFDFVAPKPAVAPTFGSTTTVNTDLNAAADITATSDFTLALGGSGQAQIVEVLASGADVHVTLPAGCIPSSSSATSPVLVASGTVTLFAFKYSALRSRFVAVSIVPGY